MSRSIVKPRYLGANVAEDLLEVVQSRYANKDDILELLFIAIGFPQDDWPPEKKWLHHCLIKSVASRSLDEGFGLTRAKPSGTRLNIFDQIRIQEYEYEGWLKHHKAESAGSSVSYFDLANEFGVSENTIAKVVANVQSKEEVYHKYLEIFADELYEEQLREDAYMEYLSSANTDS